MENLQVSVISRFTAVAAASGNDAITAGLSAGSGELAAPMIAKWMFGTDKAEKLTAEQKSTVSNITGLIGTGAGATTGNITDAVASGRASENAVDNNYVFHTPDGKVVARDSRNNGILVEITLEEAIQKGLVKKEYIAPRYERIGLIFPGKEPVVISNEEADNLVLSSSQVLDVRNDTNDRAIAEQKYGLNLYLPANTKLVFQNGVWNTYSQAQESAKALGETFNQNDVGIINNETEGAISDLAEIIGTNLDVKDILVFEGYRKLNDENKKVTIVAHSRGNHDFTDAEKANFYGEKLNHLNLISVGSPVHNDVVEKSANSLGITYLGQISNNKDPITKVADLKKLGHDLFNSIFLNDKDVIINFDDHEFNNYLTNPEFKMRMRGK